MKNCDISKMLEMMQTVDDIEEFQEESSLDEYLAERGYLEDEGWESGDEKWIYDEKEER